MSTTTEVTLPITARRPGPEDLHTFQVRLTKEQGRRLRILAAHANVSKADAVRQFIEDGLDRHGA